MNLWDKSLEEKFEKINEITLLVMHLKNIFVMNFTSQNIVDLPAIRLDYQIFAHRYAL